VEGFKSYMVCIKLPPFLLLDLFAAM